MTRRTRSMLSLSAASALAVGVPAALADPGPREACADGAAASIAAPAGEALAFALRADGVQIYACAAPAGAQPAWTLQAPEASLVDEQGMPAGKHGAGPTWEAPDGSSVVAAKVTAETPDPGAIPWLLLRAKSHAGAGRMADVSFVRRIRTSGGLAPAQGCSEATVGTVARVPYSALYCFYRGGRP